MPAVLRNTSLSTVFFGLFVFSLAGHSEYDNDEECTLSSWVRSRS
jgi:hypothetical protein